MDFFEDPLTGASNGLGSFLLSMFRSDRSATLSDPIPPPKDLANALRKEAEKSQSKSDQKTVRMESGGKRQSAENY